MAPRETEQIDFLTTNVGRGHRFYLEGLIGALNELTPETETELYHAKEVGGPLARPGWQLINSLYRRGSRSDWFGSLYSRIRSDSDPNSDSAALRLFGAGLRHWWKKRGNPLVVDHPLLVKLLDSLSVRPVLIYMHGEMVAPNESLVTGADLTIVPTEEIQNEFIDAGVASEAVAVSGLCLERALVPLVCDARELRLKRISASTPLTGAYFSSGAEPSEHCSLIVHALRDCLNAGHHAIVFATTDGRLANYIKDSELRKYSQLALKLYSTIHEEESQLASVFKELDYFVAPAHERTNWAIGAGLPFFILEPCFGSFAPLNRDLALNNANAKLISGPDEISGFGAYLNELQESGGLLLMNRDTEALAQITIDGFKQSANLMREKLESLK